MPFPHSQRVIYQRCPLAEVVAHLRFQPILRIDSEAPAAFQETIRAAYPQYANVPQPLPVGVPPNTPPQIVTMMQGLGGIHLGTRHRFASQDGQWEVYLARETLELRTTKYNRWEDFRDRFRQVRESLETIYGPGDYLRIGLRYVDVIRRSVLGLQDVPWSELLKPYIAGVLASPELAPRIDGTGSQTHCNLGDDSFLTLKAGLVRHATEGPELCFMIDCEFHTHQSTEVDDAATKLDGFNQMGGRFFRWCIQQRLHDAMEPHNVD